MEKKILARHFAALVLSSLSYHAAANTTFSSPPPSLSSINAQSINTNVKKISDISGKINHINTTISQMDSRFNSDIDTLKQNNSKLKSETIDMRNDLEILNDEMINFENINANKIQSNTNLINSKITSIQQDREKKHHAFDSKLKEVELHLQGALIGVNAADQVTDQLNTNIQNLDNKVIGNTSSIKTLKSDTSKTQKANELKFTSLENKFDHGIHQLDSKIDKRAQEANSGIASVAAMSNIPYTTNTRFSAGIGAGNYKNGSAIAAGAQYQLKENINLRSSVSWNNSDAAVIGAGVAFGW
ncbi:YadA C-terminal domain-containing protein [Providencia sp. PROV141]|uniref:YadA C-terminal domain-containing protein n=1 Tax=Providencia sp. PROV141 TaxID=2949851 RepID=UPI00234A443F|nr:YadA C-terminal domain-containing protein [Providencia sp. PROV141]